MSNENAFKIGELLKWKNKQAKDCFFFTAVKDSKNEALWNRANRILKTENDSLFFVVDIENAETIMNYTETCYIVQTGNSLIKVDISFAHNYFEPLEK